MAHRQNYFADGHQCQFRLADLFQAGRGNANVRCVAFGEIAGDAAGIPREVKRLPVCAVSIAPAAFLAFVKSQQRAIVGRDGASLIA